MTKKTDTDIFEADGKTPAGGEIVTRSGNVSISPVELNMKMDVDFGDVADTTVAGIETQCMAAQSRLEAFGALCVEAEQKARNALREACEKQVKGLKKHKALTACVTALEAAWKLHPDRRERKPFKVVTTANDEYTTDERTVMVTHQVTTENHYDRSGAPVTIPETVKFNDVTNGAADHLLRIRTHREVVGKWQTAVARLIANADRMARQTKAAIIQKAMAQEVRNSKDISKVVRDTVADAMKTLPGPLSKLDDICNEKKLSATAAARTTRRRTRR